MAEVLGRLRALADPNYIEVEVEVLTDDLRALLLSFDVLNATLARGSNGAPDLSEVVEVHVVNVTRTEWALQHPQACRPDLLSCPMHAFWISSGPPEVPPGRYAFEWIDQRLGEYHLAPVE